MLNSRSLALGACLAVLPQMVHAADDAARCIDISAPKRVVEAQHGKWIELAFDQWRLLLGIYTMNPMMPPSLPHPFFGSVKHLDVRCKQRLHRHDPPALIER